MLHNNNDNVKQNNPIIYLGYFLLGFFLLAIFTPLNI